MNHVTKWNVFGVLVLCWLGLLAVRISEDREPQRRALTYVSGQTVEASRPANSPTLVTLVSPDSASVSVPTTPSRNIFASLKFPKPKKKRTVVAKAKPAPPAPKPAAPAPPPPPSPEQLAAEQARKYLAEYRVLGYSNAGEEPRAFLGRENKIYIVERGERLEDRIEVAAITDKAVRLREMQTRVEATLAYEKKE